MRRFFLSALCLLVLTFALPLNAQSWVNTDTVEAQKFDTGKMWTFEAFPYDYFKKAYNFNPSEDWVNKVKLSAARFASWCSSSFVSEDGLIMTNHHCVDFIIEQVQKEGENIPKNGFYAPTLADERKAPSLFISQLQLTVDVTDQVIAAINSGKTDAEKAEKKKAVIKELQEQYNKETGLSCTVTSLFNGGKFSLYGYKIYKDVRLVFVNEREMGLYGGDPDNFTYPRYNADFAFVRVYDDNGLPLKTENYFKWSANGAQDGELIFVIGNPGTTQRLKTVAQLEYYRDFSYRNNSFLQNSVFAIYDEMISEDPSKADEYRGQQFFIGNGAKVAKGVLEGLRDPMFLARKKDFEKKFKESVMANPELKAKFGHVWDGINGTRNEVRKFAAENAAYNYSPQSAPMHLKLAKSLVDAAAELNKPEAERNESYKGDKLKVTIENLFPKSVNPSFDSKYAKLMVDYLYLNLGKDHWLVKKMFNGLQGKAAADFILKNSILTSKEKVVELASKGGDAILKSEDPFIYFVVNTNDKVKEYAAKMKEIVTTEQALEDQLGQALFAVYGNSIPPDATFTLRISDGVVKGYNYNGTIAPTNTTFYGMYDRYYSFKKQYPWNLPERWQKPGPDFDLSTPYNFVSTNDIVGGSSGSAVINKNAEIVGIAFDGNIESLPGNFIYSSEANRTVSVSSAGILELLNDLLGAKRIAQELKTGKIPDEYKK